MPPYRFRWIDSAWPSADDVDRRSAACDENESVTAEHGGTLSGVWVDDVAPLREALAGGRAHDEGQVELDGRVVERIRVDLVPGDRRYFYVDPETFVPVRVEGPPGGAYYLGSLKVGPLRFGIVKALPDIRVPAANRRQPGAHRHLGTVTVEQ